MGLKKRLLNRMTTTGDRVKKTRLYAMQTANWAVGNARMLVFLWTLFLQSFEQGLVRFVHEMQTTNGVVDYTCSNSKCLILDTAAATCDITGGVVAFMLGNMTTKVFGMTTSVSWFFRTLRNKCFRL